MRNTLYTDIRKEAGMNTLDKVLLTIGIADFMFVIAMIVIFCIFQSVPDTLIMAVFGATFGECGCCSYIWKHKQERKIDKEAENE